MLIELFKDDNGNITGLRNGWSENAANPPVQENVFEISEENFEPLVGFLTGRSVTVSDSSSFDAEFDGLFLSEAR